jgi:hypothetical protein
MAFVVADRVKETTTTTGTGTVTLLGASTGFQSFAVIGNSNTTYYTIAGQTGNEWEVGIGTYTSSGTTLARTTVLANSSATQPSALSFSSGTKDVFVTYPAGTSIYSSNNAGTSGQFLKTNGSGVAPTWGSVTATTVSDTANSSTGYFQLPQGTTAERPGSPTNGMTRINTSNNTLEVYSTNNTAWNIVSTFDFGPPPTVEYMVVAGGGGAAPVNVTVVLGVDEVSNVLVRQSQRESRAGSLSSSRLAVV